MDNNMAIAMVLKNAEVHRRPITATLEITTKCNYNCIHCYLGDSSKKVMPKEMAFAIIDKIKKAGGMFLNLTGGEVLTHPEFKEIYRYAVEKKLIVSVLTNGYLIDNSVLELFNQYRPRKIEITVYGMHERSFHDVTRTELNYHHVLDNIIKLKQGGHNVLVKSILLNKNCNDLVEIRDFAKKMNADFNMIQIYCRL